MNEPSLNQQLYNAVAALAVAGDRLRAMREQLDVARRAESAALSAVNEEQQKFDALVAQVKKEAPRDSDWKYRPGAPV